MTHVIAHRGASRLEPENTVAAYRRAVAVGADGIELDVRRCADGSLVCHHDARLPDGRAVVDTMPTDLPGHVPTLAAALDACRGVWVNVEIKNDPSEPDFDATDSIADAVLAALAARPEPPATWLISCFRMETVDRCRRLDPAIATAFLTVRVGDGLVEQVAASGHAALHPWDQSVDAALVERCHATGLRVNTWTCNDVDRFAQLAAWGVDGVCTDVPDVMVSEVRRGGSGRPTRA